jgi:hypothetical protein
VVRVGKLFVESEISKNKQKINKNIKNKIRIIFEM